MIPFEQSAEQFATDLNSPSARLSLRVQRLARLSAAGRVSAMTRSAGCLALMRLVLKASVAFPVLPGAEPGLVLSLVHGSQAVGATLCYGKTRRTRYLLRESVPDTILIRTVSGKESAMTRDALQNLIRGYRFSEVFVMPVPKELTPVAPLQAPGTAPAADTAPETVTATRAQRVRQTFQRAASRWQPGAARSGT